jgi:hypothetical protein
MVVLLILIIASLGGLFISVVKDDHKCKVIADTAGTLIMLILLVVNTMQGNVVWIILCGVFAILNIMALVYDIENPYRDAEKVEENNNDIDNTKMILEKFIKEIEEYGSRRH